VNAGDVDTAVDRVRGSVVRAQRDRNEPSPLREADASATGSALYATGFGGFGFLGFGGLFGVLSPTWHLLLVSIGRSTVWLLAEAACAAAGDDPTPR